MRAVIKAELHLDIDLHRHGLAIFEGRLETPLLHRLDRLFIQTVTERLRDFNVARKSIGTDNNS